MANPLPQEGDVLHITVRRETARTRRVEIVAALITLILLTVAVIGVVTAPVSASLAVAGVLLAAQWIFIARKLQSALNRLP